MTTEGHCGDILDGHIQFPSDKSGKTGGIKHTGLAHNTLRRETGNFLAQGDHGVKRIGDDDDEGIRGILLDAFRNRSHNLGVNFNQIITAHAGLTRQTCSDDNNIRTFDILVIVGSGHTDIKTIDRGSLCNIQSFSLRHVFDDVKQNDITQLAQCAKLSQNATNLSTTDQSNFRSRHFLSPLKINSPTVNRRARNNPVLSKLLEQISVYTVYKQFLAVKNLCATTQFYLAGQ